ncbi:MAG: response regulator [Candidatus Omnitrophota bacterium]|nr:response regulator [Candidatus Omnitrophota bacterium]
MKKRILLVDDDKDMCSTLADVLSLDTEFEVEYTTKPLDAVDKVRENDYSLIVLDYKMPDMNGIELLQNIRSIKMNIPVILLTAFLSAELVEKALKAGAVKVLSKFIWPNEISKQIKDILR